MMRGVRGVNGHDSIDTVVAAASAIASAEIRVQQSSIPRRRWKGWFHMYWCFGSHQQPTRISQSALVPEPTETPIISPTMGNSTHYSSGLMVAPPSSPSSFLQSEPPSTSQSPAKFLSPSLPSPPYYSPTTPSIFAVGPYANDTKLVSPPVFSTFTTEPSTAPFTPPEPPLQLTTPSSPEVPFARLLSPTFDSSGRLKDPYDFHPYQLHPGSPVGHLISPGSVRSGPSSPFADIELCPSPIAQLPPKILTARDFTKRRDARDNCSILDGRITAIELSVDDSRSMLENSGFEEAMAERDQLSPIGANLKFPEKAKDLSELEASKEFKFNVEAENGEDEELGVLHSGSAWAQLKFGFVERIH